MLLDKDLAVLYDEGASNLNTDVARDIKRLHSDFMFQLINEEFKKLLFQNGTSSWGGNRKYHYSFTEEGISMPLVILNGDWAIEVNIQIMKMINRMRKFLVDHTQLRLSIVKLENKTSNNTKNIELEFQYR